MHWALGGLGYPLDTIDRQMGHKTLNKALDPKTHSRTVHVMKALGSCKYQAFNSLPILVLESRIVLAAGGSGLLRVQGLGLSVRI